MKENFELLKQRIYAEAKLKTSSDLFNLVAFIKLAYYRAHGFHVLEWNQTIDPLKIPPAKENISKALKTLPGVADCVVTIDAWTCDCRVIIEQDYFYSMLLNIEYRSEIKDFLKIVLPRTYRSVVKIYPSIA